MNGLKLIRVRELMKTRFDMVDGIATVQEALDQMAYVETKSLIVKKRTPEDSLGSVMLSDIARKVLAKDRPPDRVNIYEVMSKPVVTVDPEMDIRYAARLFSHLGLSRAPVVDQDGEVIGIVSLTDMVMKGLHRK